MTSIPQGKWNVKVIAHRIERASTGTESVIVTFEDDTGRRIDWHGALTERGLRYTLPALENLGWRPKDHDGEIGVLTGTDLLVGAKAEIVVEEEIYNGRTKAKVKWVNRPKAQSAGKLSTQDAATLSARLRARILEVAADQQARDRGTRPNAAPPAASAGDTPHDDIPF